jgi:hypothetical protein
MPETKAPPKGKYKFKLLAGKYIHGKVETPEGLKKQKVYTRGEIIESNINLAEKWPEKFMRLPDEDGRMPANQPTPGIPSPHSAAPPRADKKPTPANVAEYHAGLDKMSVEELKAHAAEEEVDLKGANDKNQILRLLKNPK